MSVARIPNREKLEATPRPILANDDRADRWAIDNYSSNFTDVEVQDEPADVDSGKPLPSTEVKRFACRFKFTCTKVPQYGFLSRMAASKTGPEESLSESIGSKSFPR